ncbi:aspartate aminotransferase, cytoplasmic-like isoform X1 [Leucoraja erinacea]|uniref:aspartate aminotransferase, cytoplasmic-like isoform X1 n=2 Tax=Leucoraja erinaceus TaxID=7782 RepID=UPI002455E381|nr:aspartate aminotransferase, cytoplasmic-like isoform X1 [Leucoraja erinacea]
METRPAAMAGLSVFDDTPLQAAARYRVLAATFIKDPSPRKLFLGNREYCKDDKKPAMLPVVKKVLLRIVNDATLNHEYLSTLGLTEFNRAATALLLGKGSIAIVEKRAESIQVPGGNSALFIGAHFLRQWYSITCPQQTRVYISIPFWANHASAFFEVGFEIYGYRYWNSEKLCLALPWLLEDLEKAPDFSIVLLHIVAHRPTATDPTPSEWMQIAEVMKRKHLFPFFYSAAQGLATGDVQRDAWPVRHFVNERFELFCAQSFSTNFTLYNEGVGSLTIVSRNNQTLVCIRSQMEALARNTWSNPPWFGARIVATILNNPAFFAEWQENLKKIVERLMLTKEKLKEELRTLGTPGPWEHITKQVGLYIFPGFTGSQLDYLMKKLHIYLSANAQINVSKVTSPNLAYVAHCIDEAVVSSAKESTNN